MNYKFIVTAVLVLNLFTQIHAIARADIVPYPISNRETGCTFTLPEKQTVYGTSTELRQLAEIFIDRIIQDGFTGFSTTSSEQNALVKLQIDSSLAEEAYLLDSSTNDKAYSDVPAISYNNVYSDSYTSCCHWAPHHSYQTGKQRHLLHSKDVVPQRVIPERESDEG